MGTEERPQSPIDIKKGFTYNKAGKTCFSSGHTRNLATKREYMAQRCYGSLFQYQGGLSCQYLISATHPKRKRCPSVPIRYTIPARRLPLRRSPCLSWITAAGPGSTIPAAYSPIRPSGQPLNSRRRTGPSARISCGLTHASSVCCAGWGRIVSVSVCPARTAGTDTRSIKFGRWPLAAGPSCPPRTDFSSL